MLTKYKKRNLKKDLGRLRRHGPVMVTFHIQGPMDRVVLCSYKGFPIKVPPVLLLNSIKIQCQSLNLKEEIVVGLNYLLVLNVEESMRKNVKPVLMHVLALAR
ncbi:hypothetical protein MTR67_048555 [Solanum verrucosum]|uniref:Uncharacterized protein n=1 Tax=Solanum verrucosum TaxID=315347 RepID=A0AAF0UZT6_SOLVR|nr:hypothetical protein MTR67_048555 [Solanum verrucosum]